MKNFKINVGLIGYGYWGTNILRNLTEHLTSGLITVCDINSKRISFVRSIYYPFKIAENSHHVIDNPDIDAVIIATPTSTHYTLAKQALIGGKHVLVEKPLTTSTIEIMELMHLAQSKNLILMVDHIFLYNPVVRQLKKYITDNYLGKINYIDATRINLGIYQNDTNVLWDLACHDISIINYLIEEKPESVRAIGRINPAHEVVDVAYLFLYYASGLLVQINSSWASPVKMRKMIIGGGKQMVIYDDIEPSNKLIIYDYESNISLDENKNKLTDYRLGNVTIPKYEPEEALKNVIHAFYDAIRTGVSPLADSNNALEVVRILEAAQESLTMSGATISLL